MRPLLTLSLILGSVLSPTMSSLRSHTTEPLAADSFAHESRTGFRPLDLPSGGRGDEEDEEDLPETIQFFGNMYEGDGFFFLLDKSGSMLGMKMDLLKAEMTSALQELSGNSEFGIVAFSGDTISFSPIPQEATTGQVSSAHAWVQALEPYGATMMLTGAIELLTIAHISTKEVRSCIAVGDGLPNGPGPAETLAGIVAANTDQLPFHTILFGANPEATQFMQDLATQTGGTFRHSGP